MANSKIVKNKSNVYRLRPAARVKNASVPAVAKLNKTEKLQEKLNREKMAYDAKAARNASIIDSRVYSLGKIADEKLRIKTAKLDAVIANKAATAQQKQDAHNAKIKAKEDHAREKDAIKLDRNKAIAQMRLDMSDQLAKKQDDIIAQDNAAGTATSPIPMAPLSSDAPVDTVPAAGVSPVTDQNGVEPQRGTDFEDDYQDSDVTDVYGDVPQVDVGSDPAAIADDLSKYDVESGSDFSFDQSSFEGVPMNSKVSSLRRRVRSVNPVLARFLDAELDKHDFSADGGLSAAGDDGFLKSLSSAAAKAVSAYGDFVADRMNKKNPNLAKSDKDKLVQNEVDRAKSLVDPSKPVQSSFMGEYYPYVIAVALLVGGYFVVKNKKKKKR